MSSGQNLYNAPPWTHHHSGHCILEDEVLDTHAEPHQTTIKTYGYTSTKINSSKDKQFKIPKLMIYVVSVVTGRQCFQSRAWRWNLLAKGPRSFNQVTLFPNCQPWQRKYIDLCHERFPVRGTEHKELRVLSRSTTTQLALKICTNELFCIEYFLHNKSQKVDRRILRNS